MLLSKNPACQGPAQTDAAGPVLSLRLRFCAVPRPGRVGLGAGLGQSPSVTPPPLPSSGANGVQRRGQRPGVCASVWVTAFPTASPLPSEGKPDGTVPSFRAEALMEGPRDANE